jgi:CRP-like cAMP-binding protein
MFAHQIYLDRTMRGSRRFTDEEKLRLKILFSHVQFFKPLDSSVMDMLLNKSSVVEVPAGRLVYQENEIVNFMYVILSGSCLVLKSKDEAQDQLDSDPYRLEASKLPRKGPKDPLDENLPVGEIY